MFVEQHDQANSEERRNTTLRPPLLREYASDLLIPHKNGPVMRKASPYDDIIMVESATAGIWSSVAPFTNMI